LLSYNCPGRLGNTQNLWGNYPVVAENELIDPQKKEDFQNMARFRNRVVHLYDPISPEEIFKIIQDKTSDL